MRSIGKLGGPGSVASWCVAVALLVGCSGSASTPTGPRSTVTPSPGAAGSASVSGAGFGQAPTITVPATLPPPTTLSTQLLTQGAGSTVASGQVVVADLYGQTWDLRDGRPNVFDDSFARRLPTAFAVGIGRVIKGLDQTLVGRQVGSRLLVTIPADLGFGASADPKKPLSGHALVFVVDLRDVLELHSSATGTPAGQLDKGLPVVASVSGQKPAIRSTTGVKAPTTPLSGLLLRGSGERIDPAKVLALQVIAADAATGKKTKDTWGNHPDIAAASNVLALVKVLAGQNVGSRAVAVTPARGKVGARILVVDVIAQY
jgi:peptidylprolyl isomerase